MNDRASVSQAMAIVDDLSSKSTALTTAASTLLQNAPRGMDCSRPLGRLRDINKKLTYDIPPTACHRHESILCIGITRKYSSNAKGGFPQTQQAVASAVGPPAKRGASGTEAYVPQRSQRRVGCECGSVLHWHRFDVECVAFCTLTLGSGLVQS